MIVLFCKTDVLFTRWGCKARLLLSWGGGVKCDSAIPRRRARDARRARGGERDSGRTRCAAASPALRAPTAPSVFHSGTSAGSYRRYDQLVGDDLLTRASFIPYD